MHKESFSVITTFQSLCFYQDFHDGGLLPTRKLLIIFSGKAEACRSHKDTGAVCYNIAQIKKYFLSIY
jgi:hypothetical protein